MKYWLLLISFFCMTTFSYAADLSITQFPDNPGEGAEVKLTLNSDKYNLNVATISWQIDGEEVDSGVGRKTLTLTTSKTGQAQVILVKVEQDGYDPSQMQKVIEANTNFVLYEGADSYVPAFYKGRRLPGKEGVVRAAIFSFKDGDIQGLNSTAPDNYTWRVNNIDRADLSGNSKIISNIQTKVTDNAVTIQVTKEDVNGGRKVTQNTVPLQNTEVQLYKTDEKKLLKQVLGDTETGKNIYLLVEPFFFSVPSRMSKTLTYTWKINDVETKISSPWAVVFSGKENDSVRINLNLVNNQKITQEGDRGFTFKVQ